MELPGSLLGAVVGEGEKYFFTVDCPIGVQEHIHICIKRYNKILLFHLFIPNRHGISVGKTERA